MRRVILPFLIIALLVSAAHSNVDKGIVQSGQIFYTPYEAAHPNLDASIEDMPPELRGIDSNGWTKWAARRDSEIRARVAQGDEDSLVNFLLFGTSFTQRPRITSSRLTKLTANSGKQGIDSPEAAEFSAAVNERANDLAKAIAAPKLNERLLFARELVRTKGCDPTTPVGRECVKKYLLANVSRVLGEQAGYARTLEAAKLLNDPSAEFVERSKLYSTRGLSSDTSLLPNFAIEKALTTIKARGLLTPRSVRRVAIVGPGLDFTDKQDGYDFYPQQTIQPFAIIDSLLRLGLAATDLKTTTFDLSPRVNDHLKRAVASARRGVSYTIQLPRDAKNQWKPDAVSYWSRFGDRIGTVVPPIATPTQPSEVTLRAVRVKPAVVSAINVEDLNIVLQQMPVSSSDSFDLIIATNIFVYYGPFEQSLALVNVARMLRDGGLLLSNNALLELPGPGMHSVDYETVVYSDKPNDGDHIVWYQRATK